MKDFSFCLIYLLAQQHHRSGKLFLKRVIIERENELVVGICLLERYKNKQTNRICVILWKAILIYKFKALYFPFFFLLLFPSFWSVFCGKKKWIYKLRFKRNRNISFSECLVMKMKTIFLPQTSFCTQQSQYSTDFDWFSFHWFFS